MQYEKDAQVFTIHQIKQLHPAISFGPDTPTELGYAEYTPPVSAPGVMIPQVVSRFKGEAILLLDGKLADVENLIAQSDAMTQLAWKRATEFRRTSPTIAQIAGALGWADSYVDSLFIRAYALPDI